jgi:hypothetical protein
MKPDNQQRYRVREKRLLDAIALKEPDRVPIVPLFGFFSCYYSGTTLREAYESPEKALAAWRNTIYAFEPDATYHVNFTNPAMCKVLDGLSHYATQYRGDRFQESQSYTFIPSELNMDEAYNKLLSNPTEFMLRKLLMKMSGNPADANNLHLVITSTSDHIWPVVLSDSTDSSTYTDLETLVNSSGKQEQWANAYGPIAQQLIEEGFPSLKEQMVLTPFHFVTNYLQVTSDISSDLFFQTDKLMSTIYELTPFMSTLGIYGAKARKNPRVHIPLGNGIGNFTSPRHFEEFCWPSLQRLICDLVQGGCNPCVFFHGDYKPWLHVIKEVPPGTCIFHFEGTDILEAKKTLGDTVCIMGSFPNALLATGTVNQVKEHTKMLIDGCGDGGGYIMSSASHIDHAKPENVAAWMETTKGYGTYH